MFNRQEIVGPSDAVNFGRVVKFTEDGSIIIESDDTRYVYKLDDRLNRYTLESQDVMTEKTPVTWETSTTMAPTVPPTVLIGVPELQEILITRRDRPCQRITNDSPSFGTSVSVHPSNEVIGIGAPDVGKVFIYEL